MVILLAPLAQAEISTLAPLALIALVVAVGIAAFCGVFRRGSIAGPNRLGPHERLGPLWMLVIVGFSTWLIVPSFYFAVVSPSRQAATKAPATQPILTAYETAVLGGIEALAVLAVLLLGNRLLRPGGLRCLGFDRGALPDSVGPAIASIACILPLMYAVIVATQSLWTLVDLQHPNAHPLLRILHQQPDPLLYAIVIVSAVVLAPMFEELLFRAHIQTVLAYSLSQLDRRSTLPAQSLPPGTGARWMAILLTSVLFMLVHAEGWMMPPIFVLSLWLGYVYERSGNLWVSILTHAAFNTVNIIYFLASARH